MAEKEVLLRCLEQLEPEKSDQAVLAGNSYEFILDEEFRWPNWAMPKNANGGLDHYKFNQFCPC